MNNLGILQENNFDKLPPEKFEWVIYFITPPNPDKLELKITNVKLKMIR
ncbi:hypothetical protein JXJ21_25820 [candidate division KSB1 bacterium]|nr:hypothetical protein [candidate division KSB1 bacterium]